MTRPLSAWAPLPLRLLLGFGFMYHGFPKLFSMSGHNEFVGMLGGIGVPAPEFMAWVVGAVEFFGGLLLILGFLTRVVASLGIFEMAVAAITVHLPSGFGFLNVVGMTETGQPVLGMPGYEIPLLYIAGFVSLLLSGAGALSIDEGMQRRRALTTTEPVPDQETQVPDRAWTGRTT